MAGRRSPHVERKRCLQRLPAYVSLAQTKMWCSWAWFKIYALVVGSIIPTVVHTVSLCILYPPEALTSVLWTASSMCSAPSLPVYLFVWFVASCCLRGTGRYCKGVGLRSLRINLEEKSREIWSTVVLLCLATYFRELVPQTCIPVYTSTRSPPFFPSVRVGNAY